MNLRCFRRVVVPVSGALLCGILASCSGGSEVPAAASTTAAPVAIGPSVSEDTAPPSVKTLQPSALCGALDLAAAQGVSADLRFSPQAAPEGSDDSTAAEACTYATDDGTAVLSLAPTTRPYDTALTLAHEVVQDPALAGMTDVRVEPVTGLGQAAFSQTGIVVEPLQNNITHVVWRTDSGSWVLTLAEIDQTDLAGRLVPLAQQISPRLPR
ncbi:hypothetical protein [Saccharothrix deserti]|uniref:hypothetical protein n=1 Tax=Saccharothrix deserti TaxID=2593674 RepID=UPI00131B31EC|nr:hypothetical protein [Saccharothrix deserti]